MGKTATKKDSKSGAKGKDFDVEAWKAQKDEELNRAVEMVNEGVKNLINSDSWKRYLSFQGLFHRYSFFNTLLIETQLPESTRVARFGVWLKMGRHVKRGEKGLLIFVPVTSKRAVKVRQKDPTTGEETEVEEIRLAKHFTTGRVFDISQTEGEEIPEVVHKLSGDDAGELWDKVYGVCQDYGCKVSEQLIGGEVNGSYHKKTHDITVEERNALNQKTKTLVHELAHHLHETKDKEHSYQDGELVAESVAFVVSNYFGLDTGEYSFGYLAGWAQGDLEKVKKVGNTVAEIAKEIIGRVTGEADAPKGESGEDAA